MIDVSFTRYSTTRYPTTRGGEVRVRTDRQWVRFAAIYGTPPGSRIGFWRTRVDTLRGVNLRVGRKIAGPCLTLLAHHRMEPRP